MAKLYSFGASHSVGFNQTDWDNELLYSHTCYGKQMAGVLGMTFANRGRVGVGVDYTDKQILYETPVFKDDIAVVQLVGHYFFRTLYEPKNGRTFGAVVQYTSIDSNPFSFKMSTTDDVINLIDYMHCVNNIIVTTQRMFHKSVFFLCVGLEDFGRISNKIERSGNPVYRSILDRFNVNMVHNICSRTFSDFAQEIPDRYCYNDDSHFNARAHEAWGNYLIGNIK